MKIRINGLMVTAEGCGLMVEPRHFVYIQGKPDPIAVCDSKKASDAIMLALANGGNAVNLVTKNVLVKLRPEELKA